MREVGRRLVQLCPVVYAANSISSRAPTAAASPRVCPKITTGLIQGTLSKIV